MWFLLSVPTVLAFFWVMTLRANELFCLELRDGRMLRIRGRVAPGLQHELQDVLRRAGVTHARLRALREDGAARLVADGVEGDVAQRLRNVLGTVAYRDLLRAPADASPNPGQRLGWSWLAWRLDGRRR